MTPSELKYNVTKTGSHFFDESSMQFFGDTMHNYGVRAQPLSIIDDNGVTHSVWELYRKRPVKHGLNNPTYFLIDTFKVIYQGAL